MAASEAWTSEEHWVSRALARAEQLPGSTWLVGGAVALLLLALEAVAVALTPEDRRIAFNWFRALSLPLLSGYLVGALSAGLSAARAALADLAPVLPGGEDEAHALARSAAAPPRSRLRLAFAFGLAVPLGIGALLTERVAGVLDGNPIDLFFALAAVTFWTLAAITVVYVLGTGALFERLARERVCVDLFHLEGLRPFGAFGLRQALLVVGAMGLAFLLLATPEASEAWLVRTRLAAGVPLVALGLLFSAALAVGAFVQPMWAIRHRIQHEKADALEQVGARLRPHWEETAELGTAGQEARLPGLLTLRAHIVALPEWPLDGWMKRRFGLYLLIPVVSLALKAVFEELVQRVLV